jgi:hypothetical protein
MSLFFDPTFLALVERARQDLMNEPYSMDSPRLTRAKMDLQYITDMVGRDIDRQKGKKNVQKP